MKQCLLVFIMIISSLYTFSQDSLQTIIQVTDTSWKTGGKFSLTFTQVSFSNWAAGGENNYGGNGFLNLFAKYKEGKSIWDNNLDVAYGLLKLNDENARKSEDKLDFNSKYGYLIAKDLYLSANLNFNTQFSKGYKYPDDSTIVSTFMSPAYLQIGIGVDYKPTDYFSISILPITGRLTVVSDQMLANAGAYGVDAAVIDTNNNIIEPGKNTRFEFGGAVMAIFQKELIKNIELKSKLQLFSNYLENPENIDVNWDSMLSLKVNNYISTFIGLTILYDEDIIIVDEDGSAGPRTQLKQSFGLGLAMEF